MSVTHTRTSLPAAILNEQLFSLQDNAAEFFKLQTGITDDTQLREHILSVQRESYSVFPYPCIRLFSFLKFRIQNHPAYLELLKQGRERSSPLLLEIGCCFGTDIRRAIADGFPMKAVMGTDLRPEFWELGVKLFNSEPDQFAVPFIAGNIFDPQFLVPAPPLYTLPTTPAPALKEARTLTPLQGHVSAIYASAFFHLFTEENQLHAARLLASLLSPEPGSMIFGEHSGHPVKFQHAPEAVETGLDGEQMFCHSPDSWREMWDGVVFEKGTVRVDTVLGGLGSDKPVIYNGEEYYWLTWTVTRV